MEHTATKTATSGSLAASMTCSMSPATGSALRKLRALWLATRKLRRQRARMALRHHRRVLQRAEIALGREGVEQAGNFPELRNEIVALKKLEQEQKEVAARIAQIEEASRQLDAERERNLDAQSDAI